MELNQYINLLKLSYGNDFLFKNVKININFNL